MYQWCKSESTMEVKKTCDNCGETVPSYIVTYMYDSAPNDKFVLTPPTNVASNIELISTRFDDILS